jgi:2-aminoadipate transaminase
VLVARTTHPDSRYASWLAGEIESAADKAIANPASLGADRADMISFGGGQPAAESYPLEAFARAYSRAILENGREVLPYGPTEGLPALRRIIAQRLARRGIDVDIEHIAIVTGSLSGLHLVGRVTLDQGDTIVTEAPTFMGALPAWEHVEPRYLTVPVDDHGMLVDQLEPRLNQGEPHPRFIYLLPTFQNPSGVSLSLHRRQRLLDLARERDLLILEDDPYGEFWFDESSGHIPPVRALPEAEHNVVYVGTFSKILAPGIRLAFVVASPQMLQVLMRAKRGVDFHSDTLLQQAVVHLISDGDFDFEAHVDAARRLYKARRDAMLDSLEMTFGGQLKWTRPAGGFFLWLDLPRGVSGQAVADAAEAAGVAVYPGWIFYPNNDGGSNGIRLSFAGASPDRIREGMARLERAIASVSR